MKRIFGTKTYVGVMLHVVLMLAIFPLCFDVAAKGRDRGKDKDKKGDVLVSEPKSKGAKGKKAKEEEEEGVAAVYKKMKGEVGMIRPPYISIIYKRDKKTKTEYEIAMSIQDDENLELVGKETLGEIKIGDTVKINYEEKRKTYEETKEDGTVERKTKVVGRRVKKITFVSPAIEGVLTSE